LVIPSLTRNRYEFPSWSGQQHSAADEQPGYSQRLAARSPSFKAYNRHFDYDSSAVKPGEKSKVKAVADYLKANMADAVEIEGHCDERGTEEYNRSLGIAAPWRCAKLWRLRALTRCGWTRLATARSSG